MEDRVGLNGLPARRAIFDSEVSPARRLWLPSWRVAGDVLGELIEFVLQR